MRSRRFALVVAQFPLPLPTPPGEDYFAEPARMMAKAGFEVEILTVRHATQLEMETVNGLRVRRFASQPQLIRTIASGDFDLLHAHSHFRPALLTGLLARRAATVFTSHSAELPSVAWKREALVALMNRFGRIIALTPHEKEMYVSAGIAASKIAIIGDTINVEFFSQPGESLDFRQRWNIAVATSIILFVANLRRFKNAEVVLRAFRRVREQLPDSVLVVVGKDLLAQQGQRPFRELAQREGIKEGLAMTGWLPAEELRDAYAAANVVVNSSGTEQESFSISTWEAISARRPVCLPRLGTFVSTIGNSVLYHEPFDDATLASNILRYLREPDLVQAHVSVNRTLADQYSVSVGLSKLQTLYTSLLEG